jgi:hypothetical protein
MPAGRFILCVIPLLVPFVVEVFDACRGWVLAAVNTLCLLWSGVIAFVLAVVPFWRYNNLDGRTTLLQGGRRRRARSRPLLPLAAIPDAMDPDRPILTRQSVRPRNVPPYATGRRSGLWPQLQS